MQTKFLFSLLLACIAITAQAQNGRPQSLTVGDPAPPLQLRAWLKGQPIKTFEKGKVYVVEFWATWCGPCKAAMPHLSALATEYKDRVTFIGIDVLETKPLDKLQAFVDSMGHRMNYNVAAEDSNYMAASWMEAAGESGIPQTFVVNAEGRLAWIGHPMALARILPAVVNNTWDVKQALAKRNQEKELEKMDRNASADLYEYLAHFKKRDDVGKPDSALLMINEIVTKEPRLKYAPSVAYHTFSSLLQTNPHKAYEYGKAAITTLVYGEPAYGSIVAAINWNADKLNIPPEIYQLGAEAYQARIDEVPYADDVDLSGQYSKMAEWYWLAKNKTKAIEAQQKGIEALKKQHAKEMAEFELKLQKYRN